MIKDKDMKRLNQNHRAFLTSYKGDNPIESMRMAGYKGADSYLRVKAEKLLKDPLIQEALQKNKLLLENTKKNIADVQERKEFLTKVIRNEPIGEIGEERAGEDRNIELPNRMKAVEMLSKMEGDYAPQQLQLNAQITLVDIVNESYKITEEKNDDDIVEGEFTEVEEPKQLEVLDEGA